MQKASYITNSTIFVEYTFSRAAKTSIFSHVPDSPIDLLLLYAQGHTLIIPPNRADSPNYTSEFRYRLNIPHTIH
jgi:hypothetical protein